MKTLEDLLLEDAQAPMADDFFTARVMGALPAPAPRASGWKALLILGSTALGGLLAALFAPSGTSALQGVLDLTTSHYMTPSALGVVATAITLAIAGAVLASED
jgi:hypothetical protein